MGKFSRRQRRLKEKTPSPTSTSATPSEVKKIGVFVAVPALSGSVDVSIATQFQRMGANSVDPRCPWYFMTQIVRGQRPIEWVRNQISEYFVHETECEWLVMIDEDQIMPDNWWNMLAVRDADIVSGTTYCWVGNDYAAGRLRVNQYDLKISNRGMPDEKAECYNIEPPDTKGQPYQALIVGTGCIAIRRKVFHRLGCAPFKFTQYWNGRYRGAEDINFSIAARKAGFKIAVHPGVVFGHVKPLDLRQISEYVAARLLMEKEGRTHRVDDMLSLG